MKKVMMMVLALLSFHASAECFINVQACKPMQIKSAQTFKDDLPLAHLNPDRCLQRAREYRAWCNSGDVVSATFYLGDYPSVGVTVSSSGSTLYSVSKTGQTIGLKPGY